MSAVISEGGGGGVGMSAVIWMACVGGFRMTAVISDRCVGGLGMTAVISEACAGGLGMTAVTCAHLYLKASWHERGASLESRAVGVYVHLAVVADRVDETTWQRIYADARRVVSCWTPPPIANGWRHIGNEKVVQYTREIEGPRGLHIRAGL